MPTCGVALNERCVAPGYDEEISKAESGLDGKGFVMFGKTEGRWGDICVAQKTVKRVCWMGVGLTEMPRLNGWIVPNEDCVERVGGGEMDGPIAEFCFSWGWKGSFGRSIFVLGVGNWLLDSSLCA